MNLFVIPSWYPSRAFPSTGIFFREQAMILARERPRWSVGISLWGSHEPRLWLKASRPLHSFIQYASRFPVKPYENLLAPNCVEFFNPAYTWTRKINQGNIRGILEANERNLSRYAMHFGFPDIIHAHVAYPGGWIAQELSKKHKIPYVVTEHMSPFPLHSFRNDYRKILLPPLKNSDLVLGVSSELVRTLQQYGVDAKQTSNFIDEEFFSPVRVNSDVFTFLVVSRLEHQKGLNYLLDAVRKLKGENYEFQVKVIGDGSLNGLLRKQSERLDLGIVWCGEGDREFVRNAFRKSDAFVLPSLHENQPVAILEALASGLPVLTTDWSGADEMITENTGLIVEKENGVALADGMRKMLTELRFSREQVRREFDRRYAAKLVVDELEQYYQTLLD